MRIVLLCEGKSELALKYPIQQYLGACRRAAGRPPIGLDFRRFDGAPNCDQLMRYLNHYGKNPDVIAVIGLIDVYPRFRDATAARVFLTSCVETSPSRSKFRAHAAQMELEAWLLPFWTEIATRLGVSCQPPGEEPEKVNDQRPPSHHLRDLYRRAMSKKGYSKAAEAVKLFKRYDLEKSAVHCPELRALLNTLADLARLQEVKR